MDLIATIATSTGPSFSASALTPGVIVRRADHTALKPDGNVMPKASVPSVITLGTNVPREPTSASFLLLGLPTWAASFRSHRAWRRFGEAGWMVEWLRQRDLHRRVRRLHRSPPVATSSLVRTPASSSTSLKTGAPTTGARFCLAIVPMSEIFRMCVETNRFAFLMSSALEADLCARGVRLKIGVEQITVALRRIRSWRCQSSDHDDVGVHRRHGPAVTSGLIAVAGINIRRAEARPPWRSHSKSSIIMVLFHEGSSHGFFRSLSLSRLRHQQSGNRPGRKLALRGIFRLHGLTHILMRPDTVYRIRLGADRMYGFRRLLTRAHQRRLAVRASKLPAAVAADGLGALYFDLARPYCALATVMIVAQPLTGATRSKRSIASCCTALGATAGVMVPTLRPGPGAY